MKLLRYLSHHRPSDDKPYVVGGALGVIAFLIFSLFAFAVGDAYLLRSGSLAAVVSSALVSLTNADRAANAVGTLRVSPVLTAVAQAKAADMAAKGYFAHTSPEGKDPWYWFKQEGYAFVYAGENLAVDFSDSAMVESAWMNSPGHRANLLDGRYTEVGIATAVGVYGGRETVFVVQAFGTPVSTSASLSANLVGTAPVALEEDHLPVVPTEPAVAVAEPRTKPVVAGVETASPESSEDTASSSEASATLAHLEEAPPAPIPLTPSGEPLPRPWWASVVASPKLMLSYGYYALAAAILLLLAYATELEFHRRHARHAAAAASLFVLMLALFAIADLVIFSKPVLAAL